MMREGARAVPPTEKLSDAPVERRAPARPGRPLPMERRANTEQVIRFREAVALQRDADALKKGDAEQSSDRQLLPIIESAVNWGWRASSAKMDLVDMVAAKAGAREEIDLDAAAREAKQMVVEEMMTGGRFDVLKTLLVTADKDQMRDEMEKAALAAIGKVAAKMTREIVAAEHETEKKKKEEAVPPSSPKPSTWHRISGIFRRE